MSFIVATIIMEGLHASGDEYNMQYAACFMVIKKTPARP